ncbi:MAG TPA: hypothetical protein PKD50_13270, partial [Leptospiraceae bacterium]|nr:hypothetical protein [Leptospiraceae bacterium]
MKKNKSIFLIILLAVNSILPQASPVNEPAKKTEQAVETKKEVGISFVNSEWKDVVAKATKEKKFIFIDAFTTWCSPCKWMDENVY